MLLIVADRLLTGFGFAAFGVAARGDRADDRQLQLHHERGAHPMFLVAGTFFPISTLPAGIRTVAQFNPLYHCVQLVRDASLAGLRLVDLGHAGVLLLFALLMWRLAIWRLRTRLID